MEKTPDSIEPVFTGEECLSMIRLGDLAEKQFRLSDGRIIRGADFLTICKPAIPAFEGFSLLSSEDPAYEQVLSGLQSIVKSYLIEEL